METKSTALLSRDHPGLTHTALSLSTLIQLPCCYLCTGLRSQLLLTKHLQWLEPWLTAALNSFCPWGNPPMGFLPHLLLHPPAWSARVGIEYLFLRVKHDRFALHFILNTRVRIFWDWDGKPCFSARNPGGFHFWSSCLQCELWLMNKGKVSLAVLQLARADNGCRPTSPSGSPHI